MAGSDHRRSNPDLDRDGVFFTLFPIQQIRSEDRIREFAPIALQVADATAFASVAASGPQHPNRITLDTRPDGAMIVAEYPDGATALFDAHTGNRLSPLNADTALRAARLRINTTAPVRTSALITSESPEYRGPLPAWRIEFNEPSKLAVYVSASTGQVTARRSELWRVYDTLWSLHIMDWRDHENFNHAPITIVSILALLSTLAGIVLIPYRFRWRRRKPAAD
jgi:hypothetical protein